jgi:hypothetical protein
VKEIIMSKSFVLVIGVVLIAVGVFKPDLSNLLPNNGGGDSVVVPSVEFAEPTDPNLMASALKVADALKIGENHKEDGLALAKLYHDIARLIELDGDNEIVKTTTEIAEVNSVAGRLMNLQLRGQYPDLAKAAKSLVVNALNGEVDAEESEVDVAVLNAESRSVAVAAFDALAWGCFEGSK